ncbi:transposable element Tcb1 transposase [Trichonephila clavipes]|nr:transposable element Tcb1 transposase [Trichonephila clavipes]
MWSIVAQRLTQITSPAATPDELWQRMEAAWSAVPQPQEYIQSPFESMPRRVAAVISNNGGYSGYDEAHFWLNGYVNKQNCRIWSEAYSQVYVETPLHPEKLTVWCALWAGGIIGPYFFKNVKGHNELWFQQDGATCHTARATIDLLKDTFGDRLISRFGPVNWPPRSCDLTPLDYFLWGYVKSLIYADKPQTLDHLEDNIRRVIADIRPQMLEKIFENWTSRLDYIRASRGSPMPEIIFNMEEKRDSSSGNDEQNRGRRSPFPFTLPPTGYSVQNRDSVENDPDNNSSLASGDTELEDDHRDAPQVEPPPFPGPFRAQAPSSQQRGRFFCILCRRFFFVDVPEGFAFRNMPRICASCRRQQDDDDPDLNPDLVPRRRLRPSSLRR